MKEVDRTSSEPTTHAGVPWVWRCPECGNGHAIGSSMCGIPVPSADMPAPVATNFINSSGVDTVLRERIEAAIAEIYGRYATGSIGALVSAELASALLEVVNDARRTELEMAAVDLDDLSLGREDASSILACRARLRARAYALELRKER